MYFSRAIKVNEKGNESQMFLFLTVALTSIIIMTLNLMKFLSHFSSVRQINIFFTPVVLRHYLSGTLKEQA